MPAVRGSHRHARPTSRTAPISPPEVSPLADGSIGGAYPPAAGVVPARARSPPRGTPDQRGARLCAMAPDDNGTTRFTAAERAVVRALADEINRFNVQRTGIDDFEERLVTGTDEDGALIGGLYGW